MDNVLSIKSLSVDLMTQNGIAHAVKNVSLDIAPGEIHALVGESGCGKSMTAKSVMCMHDPRYTECSGKIIFNGADVLEMSEKELLKIRGREISMIFQNPMDSLNPIMPVGEQIAETLRVHLKMKKEQAREQTLCILEKVGIHPARQRYRQYPFEFSGGMIQRIMIGIAISCTPKLLIADEPTTALDVTIQAQILALLKELQQSTGMSILLITHNFGVVAEICDKVSVMYAGRIVETGDVRRIFDNPVHPYTRALIDSIPKEDEKNSRLSTISGSPPELYHTIVGCPFAPRCKFSFENCSVHTPELCEVETGHTVACHMAVTHEGS